MFAQSVCRRNEHARPVKLNIALLHAITMQ